MSDAILLPNGLRAIDAGGELRVLAALPPRAFCGLPSFGDSFEAVPIDQIEEVSLRDIPSPILNQKSSSACVGHAAVAAFLRAWQISGQPAYEFNPYWVYGLINGNRDAGAVISDALEAMKKHGVALVGKPQYGDLPREVHYTYQLQQLPQVYKKAARFRVAGAWKLRSYDEILSAVSRRMLCVIGIAVGKNFGQLDEDTVSPLPDTILGGHALQVDGIKKIRGQWMLDTQNSWTEEWGNRGRCFLRREHFNYMQIDAFGLTTVLDDSEDVTTDVPSVN